VRPSGNLHLFSACVIRFFRTQSFLQNRFQRFQIHVLCLGEYALQDRTLLDQPPGSDASFLLAVPCLRFLHAVLRLKQLLFLLCHTVTPSNNFFALAKFSAMFNFRIF